MCRYIFNFDKTDIMDALDYISVTEVIGGSERPLHIHKSELAAFADRGDGSIIYLSGNSNGFTVKESYAELSKLIIDAVWVPVDMIPNHITVSISGDRKMSILRRELAAFTVHEKGAVIYLRQNNRPFIVIDDYDALSKSILDDWSELYD